jgi:pSer/pThr/pTyr-binding forkhead associated (FHA) protein
VASFADLAAGPDPGESASLSLLAYPLVRSTRSVAPLVSLGRTPNNDVVIPDLSVSRFHAFLKPLENGRFQLQDAGSVNGSAVNGDPVPRQGSGPAVDLKSGDNVRIGRVELTYLDADVLREFVRAHDPR